MDAINGKKTYIAVIAGLIASIALFVKAGNYNIEAIFNFLKDDSLLVAIAALRNALAKK